MKKKIKGYIVLVKKQYLRRKGDRFWIGKDAGEIYKTYKIAKKYCGSLSEIARIKIEILD